MCFSNLIYKSILTKNRTKELKKKRTEEKIYCKYYNLFGKCYRGDKCTFLHDPKRIAICPKYDFNIIFIMCGGYGYLIEFNIYRFLRGTCTSDSCPYSHNASEEKIPLCSFFAAGCCNREKCPYLHVFNGKNAKYCEEFAKGFCKLGNKVIRMRYLILSFIYISYLINQMSRNSDIFAFCFFFLSF